MIYSLIGMRFSLSVEEQECWSVLDPDRFEAND